LHQIAIVAAAVVVGAAVVAVAAVAVVVVVVAAVVAVAVAVATTAATSSSTAFHASCNVHEIKAIIGHAMSLCMRMVVKAIIKISRKATLKQLQSDCY
jgi:uncharacterized membrane protein